MYTVKIAVASLAKPRWKAVVAECSGQVTSLIELLQGKLSQGVMEVVTRRDGGLFPNPKEISLTCSCPDWENPCKHIAAVLYVFADRLDDDPWLLLQWRGRSRDAVLGYLRGATGSDRAAVAPWWPLTPGAALPAEETRQIWPSGDPGHALARLGPLAVDVRGQPVTEKLADAYQALLQGAATR